MPRLAPTALDWGLFIDVSTMAADNAVDLRAELRSRRFGLAEISPWSPGQKFTREGACAVRVAAINQMAEEENL